MESKMAKKDSKDLKPDYSAPNRTASSVQQELLKAVELMVCKRLFFLPVLIYLYGSFDVYMQSFVVNSKRRKCFIFFLT